MDPLALAQQTTDIVLSALPFIYAGKEVVADKVKDMLLEKGIEKLGSKFIDKAKTLLDKIRSKNSESIETALKELSKNSEDLKAKTDLQQEILKLLTEDQKLAGEIESIILNLNVGKIDQLTIGNNNTSINLENCKIEGSIFGKSGNYCTYEGRKEIDNIFSYIFSHILEKVAPFFINRYGESKSVLMGLTIATCGCLIAFSSLPSIDTIDFSNTQSDTMYDLTILKIIFSFILVSIGSIILISITISDYTKCEKCGHGFGYKEIKRPLIEETYCTEGVVKKTTRYYKCQYCNYEKTVPSEQLIKPDKMR